MDASVTDVGDSLFEGGEGQGGPERWALLLCASQAEPARVGECFFVSKSAVLLGRGEAREGDPCRRGVWVQQRPGVSTERPPLGDPRLSRRQLVLTATSRGLELENIGRTPLSFRGKAFQKIALSEGDFFAVGTRYLFQVVKRAERWPAMRFGVVEPTHAFGGPDAFGLVGESPALWTLRDQIAFLARREQHTLLLGESGVGKELVAHAVHVGSQRGARAMIARNAATIPEGLFDAELFGNARNYPNPGMAERPGLIGAADGSTLFLDEIGELPTTLQSHLLRCLDRDGEYQRLGETRVRRSDFRLVAATNRPVEDLKPDFLARFLLRVQLPSLNARPEDVPLLVRHLLKNIAEEDAELAGVFFEAGEPRLEFAFVEGAMRRTWTRNVRELESLLWSAISVSTGTTIRVIPELLEEPTEEGEPEPEVVSPSEITPEQLREALSRHEGLQENVWRELRLKNRYVLRRLLKKYNISTDAHG